MSAPATADAQQVARAVDELRRGQPVKLTGAGATLTVLAVELADSASLAALDAGTRADLLIARPRAALLHITNQRAAEGTGRRQFCTMWPRCSRRKRGPVFHSISSSKATRPLALPELCIAGSPSAEITSPRCR